MECNAGCIVTEFLLETHALTKQFAGFVAVKDVNLRVRKGNIHALIGPNGAGKTTCFNLITKFLQPSSGTIMYAGRDITRESAGAVARTGLVRSFQISAVFPHLTALENVRLALQQPTGLTFSFWKPTSVLYRLHDRARELLEAVGLSEYGDTTAGEMPYGRKRALEIATTLALEPELMLLDEPMAGMGHEDIARVSDLIRKVSANRTVLMVEHNLEVVSTLSDVITVLQRGQILAEGPYDEVSRNPAVREAYMGTGHE